MKRDPALLPLTHDHHEALVQARRLRLAAAEEDEGERARAAQAFVDFFDAKVVNHFREEEELLLPLMVEAAGGSVPSLVERVLLDHVELHTLVLALRRGLATGTAAPEPMDLVARRLQEHIRLEEKEVFPLSEQTVTRQALAGLHFADRHRESPQA